MRKQLSSEERGLCPSVPINPRKGDDSEFTVFEFG
jgi:hypothetical protein